MDVTREFTDILQNIESAIVTICRGHPDLKDADVLLAIERLIGLYTREKKKLPTLAVSLPVNVTPLFEAMKDICEIRLTRDSVNVVNDETMGYRVPLRIMVVCLERLHDSMRFWNKKDGAKGYLNYVSRFMG